MVTKQQQLEWLARKYKMWPEQGSSTLRLSAFEIGKFAVGNAYIITREEWQQERDNMQNQDNKSECAVMTLSEAIAHANEKSRELEGHCAANHSQLAQWLTEYRDILSNLNQQNEQDNSWYERGELPPVGVVCEVLNNELYNPEWEKCTILFMGEHICIYNSESRSERVGSVDSTGAIEFRPLRTEREKAIDAACKAIDGVIGDRLIIERLYDAGLLK